MPRSYKCSIFVNIILFILVIQLRHLVGMYEMARIDFDVPTINHLKQTPIEREVKVIYKETSAREGDKMEHRYPIYTITGMYCNGVMLQ